MPRQKRALLTTAAVVGSSLAICRYKYPWIADDIESIRRFKRGQKQSLKDLNAKTYLIDKFEENVASNPDKVFIIFEEREYSYGLVDHMANKVANIASTWGVRQGDTAALMMVNEPAFIWTLLGKKYSSYF